MNEGLSAGEAIVMVERMNEVAFARFHGMELSATKGCFDAARAEIPLS